MIFPGYVAIGKTFVASKDNNFIDLDSYYFKNCNQNYPWYKTYCDLAIKLSEAGYNVFTACHDEVLKHLSLNYDKVVAIYPSIELKEYWMERTLRRYNKTGKDKDKKAYERVCNYFDNDVANSHTHGIKVIFLDKNSDLESICLKLANNIN